MLAFVHRQANSLSQHRVTPVEVGVRIHKCSPKDRERLENYFGCPVDTEGARGWFIRYAYDDVMEPYAAQNAMLREANEQILNRVRQYSFTVRVEEEIEELLKSGEGVRIQDVAARLNMSSRTPSARSPRSPTRSGSPTRATSRARARAGSGARPPHTAAASDSCRPEARTLFRPSASEGAG